MGKEKCGLQLVSRNHDYSLEAISYICRKTLSLLINSDICSLQKASRINFTGAI